MKFVAIKSKIPSISVCSMIIISDPFYKDQLMTHTIQDRFGETVAIIPANFYKTYKAYFDSLCDILIWLKEVEKDDAV